MVKGYLNNKIASPKDPPKAKELFLKEKEKKKGGKTILDRPHLFKSKSGVTKGLKNYTHSLMAQSLHISRASQACYRPPT
jgi:hypothetical protein